MSALPSPTITEANRPYWEGLAAGRLLFQRCAACGHAWLPAREACPACLAAEPGWEASAGRGRVVSWVVYHVAYHDALKKRVPYDVTLIELDEGPRLLGNVIDSDAGRALRAGAPVTMEIQKEGEVAVARFRFSAA